MLMTFINCEKQETAFWIWRYLHLEQGFECSHPLVISGCTTIEIFMDEWKKIKESGCYKYVKAILDADGGEIVEEE